MKIRTAEHLYDFTSSELAWRKKELFELRSLVIARTLTPSKKNVLIRSTIALIYAHWEGFIKSCATAYIQFVAMQKLRHEQLSPNFIALAIRPILLSAFQSKKVKDHQKVVDFFLHELPTQSSITYQEIIDTQSNLSTLVFRNIVETLGFDYSSYETKEKLLDERLLRNRNRIAHGEYVEVSESEVLELQDECIGLMEIFRTQIDNAVTLRVYTTN
ncbi:MAG: MAE_28990/MAE_18760 family HEPN-like nuclease [Anaerolineales bacterium]